MPYRCGKGPTDERFIGLKRRVVEARSRLTPQDKFTYSVSTHHNARNTQIDSANMSNPTRHTQRLTRWDGSTTTQRLRQLGLPMRWLTPSRSIGDAPSVAWRPPPPGRSRSKPWPEAVPFRRGTKRKRGKLSQELASRTRQGCKRKFHSWDKTSNSNTDTIAQDSPAARTRQIRDSNIFSLTRKPPKESTVKQHRIKQLDELCTPTHARCGTTPS